LTDLGKHLVDYQRLMAHWNVVSPRPILTLTYESVVEGVEQAARTLLDYIGVAWEPQVLDFQNLERPVKTASVWQVRQPVYQTSKAKWRRYAEYLAPLETALNESLPDYPPPAEIDPLTPGLFFEAMAQLKAGQARAAEQSFRQILTRFPRHAAALHFLGMALYQQGQLRESLAKIRQSIDLHPGHADWVSHLQQVEAALTSTESGQGCG